MANIDYRPPSTFKLADFISEVKSRGLSKPNRFEVEFARMNSDSKLVSLFCEISNLPGISINTKGLRIYGPAYQRPVSAEFGGEAINMTFYVDSDFHVKKYFDDWIFKVVNPNSFNVQYEDNYKSDITIRQLNEKNQITYQVKLIDAFPRAINMMDLNMASDNQVHKLNVTFSYRKWVTRDSEAKEPQLEGPLAILTSK
jgi:hypothetical protein